VDKKKVTKENKKLFQIVRIEYFFRKPPKGGNLIAVTWTRKRLQST